MIKILVVGIILSIAIAQNNGDLKPVTINALFLCNMDFRFNSTTSKYELKDCTYFVPGANKTLTTWPECYAYCCPGFKQPQTTTIDDVSTCINGFSSKPVLVDIIGIIIGIILLIIFIIIPCCCSKDSIYGSIKIYLAKRLAQQEDQEDYEIQNPIQVDTKMKQQKIRNTPGSHYTLQQSANRLVITSNNIDQFPSEQRKCFICKKGKSNLKLNCLHNFHNDCIKSKAKNLQKCLECMSQTIYPVLAYCSICERRYVELQSLEVQNTYICKICEEEK